jgi:hypothetical protein
VCAGDGELGGGRTGGAAVKGGRASRTGSVYGRGRTVEGGGKDGEPEVANEVGHVEQHRRRRHRRRHAAACYTQKAGTDAHRTSLRSDRAAFP